MCVTWGSMPASRRKRTRPRWYSVARNPPPERARPNFFMEARCEHSTSRARGLAGDQEELFRYLMLAQRPESTLCPSPGQLPGPRFLYFHDGSHLAELQHLFGRGRGEQVHRSSNDTGPTGLMAGAQAGAVVAMEVLVKQDQVAPVRVVLELLRPTVDRTPAILVLEEDAGASTRDLFSDLIQVHEAAGTRWAFHLEIVAVVAVVLQQRAN